MPLSGSIFTEDNFKRIIEYAPIGIVLIDKNFQWLLVNQRFCEIIGYNREELKGKTFLDITHPLDRQNNISLYQKLISGELNEYYFEKRYIRKDNRVIWARLTVAGVRIQGEYSHLIALIQDIDENKKYQQAIEAKNLELATLFYKVSHDLKSPVTSLKGISQLMSREQPDLEITAYLNKTVAQLEQQNQRLMQLVQINETQPETKEIWLESMISEISSKWNLTPQTENLKWFVQADHYLLALMLDKIFENSIAYTNPARNLILSVSYNPETREIRVKDNGLGIEPDSLPKVFDMFFKGSEASTGSGFGLYLVKKAAEKMNVEVGIESELGKGTVVAIRL